MSLETATYINQLNPLNPDGAVDLVSTSDDHLKLIKSTLKNTFPNVTGPVNLTQAELNSNQFLIDSGTANAIVVTPSPAWTSYVTGLGFVFRALNNSTTTAVTIKVNALSPVTVVTADGNPPVIYSNSIYDVVFNGTAFIIKNSTIKAQITDSVTYTPLTLGKTLVQSTSGLSFGTASTERITIDTSGNVGIGTTTPAYNLDIVGTAIRLQNGTNTGYIYPGPQTNQGYFFGDSTQIGLTSSTSGAQILVSKDATNKAINITAGTGSTGKIFFNTNGSVQATIDSTGNLNLGYYSGAAKVNISSADNPSSGYATFLELSNLSPSATNAKKTIRTTATGTLEIRNSANTSNILSITDAGILTLAASSIDATAIAAGTLNSGVNVPTKAVNDSSTAPASTQFVNRNSAVSTTASGYNWYTLPSGHIILWSSISVPANGLVKVTLSSINAYFTGKTIVSGVTTTQARTATDSADFWGCKFWIGTGGDLGTFTLLNAWGATINCYYQVVLV